MASYSNTNGSSRVSPGVSAHGRPPRPPSSSLSPVRRAADTRSSNLHKMDLKEEIEWGMCKYNACLELYKSTGKSRDGYIVLLSDGIHTLFLRNIAQKLIASAFQLLKPLEDELKRMSWRIEVVLGGRRTKVKGYPGGGLVVFPGDKKLLIDWQENEVAVLLASAIVDILLHSDAVKCLQGRGLDEYRLIPQVAKPYLTRLGSFLWERERAFVKDLTVLLTMEGAGYDRQSIIDWYRKVQLPPFYKYFEPSYKRRARRLHAWFTEANAPMISRGTPPFSARRFRPIWHPEGKRIKDLDIEQVERYKRIIRIQLVDFKQVTRY